MGMRKAPTESRGSTAVQAEQSGADSMASAAFPEGSSSGGWSMEHMRYWVCAVRRLPSPRMELARMRSISMSCQSCLKLVSWFQNSGGQSSHSWTDLNSRAAAPNAIRADWKSPEMTW